MRRVLTGFLCLMLAVGLCACGGTSSVPETALPLTWQEQYELGIKYLSEGNYEEAALAFTAAIEIDPKKADAYVGRGDAYVNLAAAAPVAGQADGAEQGEVEYRSALADYLLAISLDKLASAVYGKLAEVYLALGDVDSAVAALQQGFEATGEEALSSRMQELLEDVPTEPEENQYTLFPRGVEWHAELNGRGTVSAGV